MNHLELQLRVRSLTRDLSNAIFRKVDVTAYINEAIERIQQVLPVFDGMESLVGDDDVPKLLPNKYHHLLSVYASSRLFQQDDQHYQASTFMNEFETKLDELKTKLETGQVTIVDPDTGEPISMGEGAIDYVYNAYHIYRGVDE